MKLEENEIQLNAGLDLFESVDEDKIDVPESIKALQNVDGEYDESLFDEEDYVETIIEEFVFNLAIGDDKLVLTDDDLNKIVYSKANGYDSLSNVFTYDDADGSVREITYGIDTIWFVLEDNKIIINSLFKLQDIPMLLEIETENISTTTDEIVLDVISVTFGKDASEEEADYIVVSEEEYDVFIQLLKDSTDFQFLQINDDSQFVISVTGLNTIIDEGSQDDTIHVNTIELVNGQLLLGCEAKDQTLQNVIDDYSNAINTVLLDQSGELETALDNLLDDENPGVEQDLFNQVEDIQSALVNNEELDTEDIAELFDLYGQLDSNTQDDFMGVFEDLVSGINPNIFDDFNDGFSPEENE